jgi:cysteine sulfinate desulfinase/cysteine desulfurase-like protein
VRDALRADTVARIADAREQRNRRSAGLGSASAHLSRDVVCCCTSTPAQSAGKVATRRGRDRHRPARRCTAHKIHGPKGVGALCLRREPRLGLVPAAVRRRSGARPALGHAADAPDCRGSARLPASRAKQMREDMARIGALRRAAWARVVVVPGVS